MPFKSSRCKKIYIYFFPNKGEKKKWKIIVFFFYVSLVCLLFFFCLVVAFRSQSWGGPSRKVPFVSSCRGSLFYLFIFFLIRFQLCTLSPYWNRPLTKSRMMRVIKALWSLKKANSSHMQRVTKSSSLPSNSISFSSCSIC